MSFKRSLPNSLLHLQLQENTVSLQIYIMELTFCLKPEKPTLSSSPSLSATFMEKQQAPKILSAKPQQTIFFHSLFVLLSAPKLLSVKPQQTRSESQSSCSTELSLSSNLSPTPTEAQISAASMKRKLSSSEFPMTARKRVCSEELEKEKISQNWGYSQKLMLYDDPWKIKKILTQSDVDESSRLLMAKGLVEELVIPVLDSQAQMDVVKNGTLIVFWDVNDKLEYRLILKMWPSTKCYVFVDGWKKNFVHRRNLKKGDEVGLHWDPYNRRFNFTVFNKVV